MFLDTSVIIDLLAGRDRAVEYAEGADQLLTSSICVGEYLNWRVGRGSTDIEGEREQFAGVQAIPFTDRLAREAGRLQDRLMDEGDPLSAPDLFIAATARDVGQELVVADADFEIAILQEELPVTNLRR